MIRRRHFLAGIGTGLGFAGAGLRTSRAQQPVLPLVGWVMGLSTANLQFYTPAVRQGLKEAGYVDGQNVTIDSRAADGINDRLPAIVQDLIARNVRVILAAGGTAPATVAKAATSTIPIVFTSAADPIKAGLVASIGRPGANVTGVSLVGSALEAKRLELLDQVVPQGAVIAVFVNPEYPDSMLQIGELEEAARALGRQIGVLRISSDADIDAAPAELAGRKVAGLLVAQDIFFNSRRLKLVALAAQLRLPAIYNQREYVEAGGLMSYGTDFKDGYRLAGVYVGRILSGAQPGDLPVQQPTKFELAINARTAKTIGLELPSKLMLSADEVME